ncbi:hypothetical protein KIF59_08060 [Enterobacter cloacae subsp. cloacae]|nr:hypothetical protein [Enterobacter cloacae subsp. cloacae]
MITIKIFGLDDSAGHNEIVSNLNEEILELVQRHAELHMGEEDNILSYTFLKRSVFLIDYAMVFSVLLIKQFPYHLMEIEMTNNGAFEFEVPTNFFNKNVSFWIFNKRFR